MHEVFRDWDSAKVGLVDQLLKSEGFHTALRNWTGSNITEVPIQHVSERLCFESRGFRSLKKDRDRLFFMLNPKQAKSGSAEVRGEVDGVFSSIGLPALRRRRSIKGSLLALISGCSSIHLSRDQESDHSCPAEGHGPCPFCSINH